MKDLIIFGAIAAVLLVLIVATVCVSLSWIHYPQGIIKTKRLKRRRTMKRELCVPCAVKLAGTNDVRKIGHRRDKITCSECQRRRYGGEYEVKPIKEHKQEVTT